MDERSGIVRQSVEHSGKTLEDALQRAAEELGTVPDELEYEVIENNTRTILGIVRAGKVTVRAWVPVPEAEVEQERLPERPSRETRAREEAEVTARPELRRNPPELEATACEVVSALLDKMGVLAAVEVVDRGGEIDSEANEVSPLVLNAVGDDLGVLIGRRGDTLRDLQFIVRLIVNRKLGVWPNLVVDVEGYKARREVSLRSLAKRMADQVRRTERPVVLEPMPPNERRIIHVALRDDVDVYTESTGEDDKRKVQILPK